MKLYITAKPRSRKEYIKRINDTHYIVAVKEPPVDGKANGAILKSLAKYFHIAPSQIQIVKGITSRQKVIEVPDTCISTEDIQEQKKLF